MVFYIQRQVSQVLTSDTLFHSIFSCLSRILCDEHAIHFFKTFVESWHDYVMHSTKEGAVVRTPVLICPTFLSEVCTTLGRATFLNLELILL